MIVDVPLLQSRLAGPILRQLKQALVGRSWRVAHGNRDHEPPVGSELDASI